MHLLFIFCFCLGCVSCPARRLNDVQGGVRRYIRGHARCWPARRRVRLLLHPPGSGFAAVPAFFSREFQVTPGSGGRLRSGPGNEGMSLALFASAVFLNPQRQQATSSACLQGLVLHHGKLWSDRLDEVGGLAHFSGGGVRLLSTASLERGTRHSSTIWRACAPT